MAIDFGLGTSPFFSGLQWESYDMFHYGVVLFAATGVSVWGFVVIGQFELSINPFRPLVTRGATLSFQKLSVFNINSCLH